MVKGLEHGLPHEVELYRKKFSTYACLMLDDFVDDLEEVGEYYRCFKEIISLMESGLELEHAHMAGHLLLVKPYMVAVQSNNVTAVNEALNEIANEKHKLLEMRRVAAYIYKKPNRWKQSTGLSKKDNLYKDAMETASQFGDCELPEGLLIYIIEQFYISMASAVFSVGDDGITDQISQNC
ncbi:hypothetical protein RHSIM_Rhsim12G0072600 [Rhododendron simsii]|uniref:Uncharacterized protein n=1 Tax=Rhododendron simsii TaxID=118357 RepID=A0A834G9X5_RHOSS|nr:hypothetical protein RHSIM_Rhsim12G0072600 [Rhododendron simsii]